MDSHGGLSSEVRLSERITALETAGRYERENYLRELGDVHLRLMHLERRRTIPSIQPEHLNSLKLCLAVLLPVVVYLYTGSLDEAEKVSSLFGK